MNEMVERVARAIFAEAQRQAPVPPFGYAEADGGKTVLDGAYDLEAFARAAINAMFEPTDDMYEAVSDTGIMWKDNNSTRVYQTMIAGALKSSPATETP